MMRRTILVFSVFALVLASCGGSSEEAKPSGSTTVGASASAPAATGSLAASPTPGYRLDYDFPPWDEAVRLFDYDASEPLGYKVLAKDRHGGATVHDVEYRSSGYAVPAWLVIPDGRGPFPTVLYAHGRTGTTGRDWFLEDAIALAQDGYAGLLITGPDTREPYLTADTGDPKLDVEAYVQYAVDLRRGLDLLETLPEIDGDRIGFVGYSWGAAMGAYLCGLEDLIDACVFASGGQGYPCTPSDGSGSICHVTDDFLSMGIGSLALSSERGIERYVNEMMVLNTVPYLGHNEGAAFLFQFSKTDQWATASSVRAVFEAAPEPKALRWYEGGHTLGCEFSLWNTSCRADTHAYAFHRTWLRQNV